MFSKILLLGFCCNRKIHIRFYCSRTGAHVEIWTSRRKDSVSDQHWHYSRYQHALVIWATGVKVAKRGYMDALAFSGTTTRRKGQRNHDGCKTELLLAHQFRWMRERVVEACWRGRRKQETGSSIDEDVQWSILEETNEQSEYLYAQSKFSSRSYM